MQLKAGKTPVPSVRRLYLGPAWKIALRPGFVVQLLLILFVTSIGIGQLKVSKASINNIVDIHMRKQSLPKTMVASGRERTVNLFGMVQSEDPFQRDELYLQFNQNAADFVAARTELLSLPLSGRERELLEQQRKLTAFAQPIQSRVVELINAGSREGEKLLLHESIPAQNQACRKYNPDIKIVFASTRQIYGKPDYLPVNENHPLQPVDVNGINKMAGESYHVLYNNVYGIRSCVLRLTNTYGPRMRIKDARQTFVGIWLRLLLEGRPFEVWEGHQLRDFNYVDDCVAALLLAAEREEVNGQSFNLGDRGPVSLLELANLLVELHGSGSYSVHLFPADRNKIDIGDYYSDFSKYQSATGWMPKINLREGLTRTLEYFRANLAM